MVPKKTTSTRFSPPWLTRDIKRLSKHKQHRFNVARTTGLEKDWAAYRKIKKEIQSSCHKAYNNYRIAGNFDGGKY